MIEPDVRKAIRGNGRQRLSHAVDERFGPDEAVALVAPCLGDEVFATAESDLEPHVIDQVGKQGSQRGRRYSEVDGE